MNRRLSIIAALLCVTAAFTSCAYMQTHKQVAEMGCNYHGNIISKEDCSTWNIYQSEGKWYIPTQEVTLYKDYPVVKDTILHTENNEPQYLIKEAKEPKKVAYFQISDGTAQVLIRRDGYANIEDLVSEITALSSTPKTALRGATKHPILADIVAPCKKEKSIILGERTPEDTPFINQLLSKVDLVLVDVPGTVLYNLAIPIMSPIKFFSEFNINN